MSKKERKKRQEARERGELKKQLLTYSMAAGAALIGGSAAEAAIVYSGPLADDFSPTHGPVMLTMEGVNPDLRLGGWSAPSGYGDGRGLVAAVGYWMDTGHTWQSGTGLTYFFGDAHAHATLQATTNYTGYPGTNTFAVALGQSATMGPAKDIAHGSAILYYANNYGNWGDWSQDGQRGFLGIRFSLEAGGLVYSWMEVERVADRHGRLLGWAYEDDGTAIHIGDTGDGGAPVPEPGGLALLASGAAGLMALRKKRTE